MTTLHGAALRSHGRRLQRERDLEPRAALLEIRGWLALEGIRVSAGLPLADGVRAGVRALLDERRARGGR